MVSTFCPAKQTVLRLNVARSSSRVRKLCTGWDAVYSLGALRRGLPVRRLRDTLALATGENRSASVEARSWSSNSVGRQGLAHVLLEAIRQRAQQGMRPRLPRRGPVKRRP